MLTAWHRQFRVVSRGSQYIWRGTLQPSPLSEVYTVEIRYRFGESPHVVIISPPLRKRGKEPIPHLYANASLCLYTSGQWSGRDFIALTIVPWTVLWLYYYEAWHATGEWLGGGMHISE